MYYYFTEAMRQAVKTKVAFVSWITIEQYRQLLELGYTVIFKR